MPRNYPGEDLTGVTFGGDKEQDLRSADFSGAIVRKADFRNANLCDADFTGAEIGGADFSGTKLRGAKFTNATTNVADAALSPIVETFPPTNFERADIHGADFTDASLGGASFLRVKAGPRRMGYALIVLMTFAISLFSAFPAAVIITFSTYFIKSPRQKLSFASLFLIGIFSFLFTALWRTFLINTDKELISIFLVRAGTGMIFVVLIGAFVAIAKDRFQEDIGTIFSATLTPLTLLIIVLALVGGGNYLGIVDQYLADQFPILKNMVPNLGTSGEALSLSPLTEGKWFVVIFGALVGAPYGCWFASLAISGDKRFDWLWNTYIEIVANSGAVFTRADLTDANFQSANLKGSNFRDAKLIRTSWRGAKFLEFSLVGKCYLDNPKVRKLVVGQRLKSVVFDRLDLTGINLDNVDLSSASFIEATLSQSHLCKTNLSSANLERSKLDGARLNNATLQDANLSGANLHSSQLCKANLTDANLEQAVLSGANLTEACLTGACIENWNIDERTVLKDVVCKYIYEEKLSGRLGWRRVPAEPEEFGEGDFRKEYGKDSSVAQLRIPNNHNQRAVDAALRRLVKQHPDIKPDAIKEIKPKDDSVIVSIQVPNNTDKNNFEQEFQKAYRLEEEENSFNSDPDNAAHTSSMDPMDFVFGVVKELKDILSNSSEKSPIVVKDSKIGNLAQIVQRDMNSNQTFYEQEEKKTLSEAASEIQSLLKQLSQENPDASESEKIAYVNKTTKPELKQRAIAALRAGGYATLDEVLGKNPYVKVVKKIIEAWEKPS